MAEGWVTQRGRSIVFGRAESRTASSRPAAASLIYKVRLAGRLVTAAPRQDEEVVDLADDLDEAVEVDQKR